MALMIGLLTDILKFSYSAVVIEVTKVLLVSFGWIGGLTVFVYWKDKRNNSSGTTAIQ